MDENVLDLLDALEDLIENSRSMPFSSKVSIDKDVIFEMLKDVRLFLPNEIKQSKWVMEERTKIISEAQREAEEIKKDAENRINKLIDEHEITRRAYEEAELIIENAKKTSKEMRLGAMEYADNILEQMQNKIQESLNEFKVQNNIIEKFYTQTMETIYLNRQELRSGNKK